MASSQVPTSLTSAAPLDGDEVFHVVDDPSGTPTSKKATPDDIVTRAAATFLELDTSNDPLTGPLSIVTSGHTLLLQNTEADSTNKTYKLASQSYDTDEEPVTSLIGSNTSTANMLGVGGGSSQQNAVTDIAFYTASALNTVSGTEAMRIDSAGNVGVGTSSPETKLHVAADAGSTPALNDTYLLVNHSANAQDDCGAAIIAGSLGIARLHLGIPTDEDRGILSYTADGADILRLGTNVVGGKLYFMSDNFDLNMELDSNGNLIIHTGLINQSQTSTASDPTTVEYPNDGDTGVHHNTASGNRYFVWNDGGTIFKAQMT